jgi:hypothetical protein
VKLVETSCGWTYATTALTTVPPATIGAHVHYAAGLVPARVVNERRTVGEEIRPSTDEWVRSVPRVIQIQDYGFARARTRTKLHLRRQNAWVDSSGRVGFTWVGKAQAGRSPPMTAPLRSTAPRIDRGQSYVSWRIRNPRSLTLEAPFLAQANQPR